MPPSPLLGYNNNVRHKGKVFHIQTEDSGVKYGHIMTHLFTDGGRILKSVKTSYAEYIGNERMSDIVREMMKQQHKAMLIALRDGKFDALGAAPAGGPPSSAAVTAREPRDPAPRAGASGGERAAPDAETEREEPEEILLDVDVEVLERASDLPPPPAHLLRAKRAPGAAPPAPMSGRRPPAAPAKAPSAPSHGAPAPPPTRGAKQAERRYAPTRPASIFGQARPQRGKSIFGEDLMGDKSLDEVILSYIADDLESGKK
jgi:hypothetical protein